MCVTERLSGVEYTRDDVQYEQRVLESFCDERDPWSLVLEETCMSREMRYSHHLSDNLRVYD